MMQSIFPEDEKFMESGDYFNISKLPEFAETRFRIVTGGVSGWKDWTADRKPLRFRPKEKPAESINPASPVKEFFACVIWNYDLEKLQIWEVTQKKVKATLKGLEAQRGAPINYDLKITRAGKEKQTQYTILPCSVSPIPADAEQALEEKPINLEALYDGGNPFQLSLEAETGLLKRKAI